MFTKMNKKLSLQISSIPKKYFIARKYSAKADAKELPTFEYPVTKDPEKYRVYAWGLKDTGALGLKYSEKNFSNESGSSVQHPKRLHFAEKHFVTDVASGYGFSLFAVKSTKQKLYGTGINTDSQIGSHYIRSSKPLELLVQPLPINLPLENPETTNVIQVAAGRAHSLILTDKEGVFSMGNNSYGQCGRPINKDEIYLGTKLMPHQISNINDQVTAVECGQDHSLFVTKSGKVFSCGWGADGQTGLSHYKEESVPSQVKGDIAEEKIIKVACAADCVLAINENGDLFGWGNNEYFQFPFDMGKQQLHTPMYLRNCRSIGKVVDIATGGSFCMILNDKGEVYVWGYGILGKGPKVDESGTPTLIMPILFGMNDFNPDIKVTSIACGISHMAAVTSKGDLFTWGRNKHGCLGLGNINDQYFPYKVCLGGQVKKISCGVDHSLALCKPFI